MDVYAALADPVRRSLLEQLAGAGSCRVVDLTIGRGISRPAVSRHLRLLGEAGLVSADDVGRERHYRLSLAPLDQLEGYVQGLRAAADAESQPAAPGRSAPGTRRPPVTATDLDALDLEVRRTVRERRSGEPRHTKASTDTTEETA